MDALEENVAKIIAPWAWSAWEERYNLSRSVGDSEEIAHAAADAAWKHIQERALRKAVLLISTVRAHLLSLNPQDKEGQT